MYDIDFYFTYSEIFSYAAISIILNGYFKSINNRKQKSSFSSLTLSFFYVYMNF